MKVSERDAARRRRHRRVRKKVVGTSNRPRLAVFRSSKHIYAQLIDDVAASTIVAAASVDPEIRSASTDGGKKAVATKVGTALAAKAKEAGISEAVFDRGGFKYHGRVAALADAARDGGLSF